MVSRTSDFVSRLHGKQNRSDSGCIFWDRSPVFFMFGRVNFPKFYNVKTMIYEKNMFLQRDVVFKIIEIP